jgi:hypothetical protein
VTDKDEKKAKTDIPPLQGEVYRPGEELPTAPQEPVIKTGLSTLGERITSNFRTKTTKQYTKEAEAETDYAKALTERSDAITEMETAKGRFDQRKTFIDAAIETAKAEAETTKRNAKIVLQATDTRKLEVRAEKAEVEARLRAQKAQSEREDLEQENAKLDIELKIAEKRKALEKLTNPVAPAPQKSKEELRVELVQKKTALYKELDGDSTEERKHEIGDALNEITRQMDKLETS